VTDLIRSPRDAGAVVRAARQRQQLSQAELALRAGVSRQWVVQFERGKSRAELIVFLRVLEALAIELTASSSNDDRRPRRSRRKEARVVDLDALLEEHVRGGLQP
jgi:HTH-type transcriptional regulator/antitoxin HipB